jgi:hypothetical protein
MRRNVPTKQEMNKALEPERKFCSDCCYYIDGKKELEESLTEEDTKQGRAFASDFALQNIQPVIHEIGKTKYRARMTREPGLQLHRFTNGDMYERIGSMVPCHRAAGVLAKKGMEKKDENGKYIGENLPLRTSKANGELMRANAGQYAMPEPPISRWLIKPATPTPADALVGTLAEKMTMTSDRAPLDSPGIA